MIKLLKLAIDREREFIRSCQVSDQCDNPQVVKMRLEAAGRLCAFEAVLDAMRGSPCLLNIWAGK